MKGSSQAGGDGRALKIVIAALLILVCGYSLAGNIITVTMTPIINTFALTGTSQGLMTSMINLGSFLSLIILPLLQGHMHKVKLIICSAAVIAGALFLTGAVSGLTALLTICLILGAGTNFLDTVVNAYIVDLSGKDGSKNLGLVHGFYGIGGLLTPILITSILARGNWRSSYYISGAIFCLIGIMVLIAVLPRYRGITHGSVAAEKKLTGSVLKSYITDRRNILLLIAAVFYGAAQLGLVNWVVQYMTVRFNDMTLGSAAVSAYWICCTACRLFNTRLPINPGKLLTFGAFFGGIFHAVGVLSGNAVVMVVASGAVGLVSGVCVPLLVSEAALGNEEITSLTTSGIFFVMAAARMLMPLGMGMVAGSSITAAMLLPALAGVISAAACAMAFRLRKSSFSVSNRAD